MEHDPSGLLVQRLEEEGVSGLLVVADRECRILTVVLPALAESATGERACSLRAPGARPGEPLLLSPDALRRTGVADPQVVDHLRLSPATTAVLLAWPGGGYVLGVYENEALIASHRWGGEGPGRLEAAPGGGLFTARPARVFRADGSPVTLAPRFRNARAVEWSPDGRWAALAMGGAVVLVPTTGLVGGEEARRAIRLPFPARDVAWRSG